MAVKDRNQHPIQKPFSSSRLLNKIRVILTRLKITATTRILLLWGLPKKLWKMASICKEILSFRSFSSRWLRSRIRKRGRLRGGNLYFLLALSLSSNAMQIVHLRKNKKPFSVGNACELCLKNVLRLDSFLTLSPVILPPSKRMKAARKSFLFKFPGGKDNFKKVFHLKQRSLLAWSPLSARALQTRVRLVISFFKKIFSGSTRGGGVNAEEASPPTFYKIPPCLIPFRARAPPPPDRPKGGKRRSPPFPMQSCRLRHYLTKKVV